MRGAAVNAHSRRRYFEGDLNPPLTVEVTPGLLIWLTLMFGLTHGLALSIGWMMAEPEPVIVTQTKQLTPLMQFKCDGAERQEYLRICAQRARSAITKPKE